MKFGWRNRCNLLYMNLSMKIIFLEISNLKRQLVLFFEYFLLFICTLWHKMHSVKSNLFKISLCYLVLKYFLLFICTLWHKMHSIKSNLFKISFMLFGAQVTYVSSYLYSCHFFPHFYHWICVLGFVSSTFTSYIIFFLLILCWGILFF